MRSIPRSTKSIWHCRPSNLDLKFEYYAISYILLDWFNSYVTKCCQFVKINNAQSETLFDEYCVSQGPVDGNYYF